MRVVEATKGVPEWMKRRRTCRFRCGGRIDWLVVRQVEIERPAEGGSVVNMALGSQFGSRPEQLRARLFLFKCAVLITVDDIVARCQESRFTKGLPYSRDANLLRTCN